MKFADLFTPPTSQNTSNTALRRVRRVKFPSLTLREKVCVQIRDNTHVPCIGKESGIQSSAPSAPIDLYEAVTCLKAKETTPEGLCPTCWPRIAAPINGPTCACRTYDWPTWTPEQIAAASTDRE